MACLLTLDFSFLNCKGGAGGAKRVYLTEWANLSGTGSAITKTAGNITAWTLATGKKFRTWDLEDEMIAYTDPLAYNKESGAIVYNPTVAFTIKGFSQANFQEIHLIAQNYLCIIVEDNNGAFWVYGYDRPMDLDSVDTNGGQKLEDGQKQLLQFSGKDTQPIYSMDASLITALTA
jgi:hypothetical protein